VFRGSGFRGTDTQELQDNQRELILLPGASQRQPQCEPPHGPSAQHHRDGAEQRRRQREAGARQGCEKASRMPLRHLERKEEGGGGRGLISVGVAGVSVLPVFLRRPSMHGCYNI
jgi:hypothetical protein